MVIGDDMVDTDHRHLVDLINTVDLALHAAQGAIALAGGPGRIGQMHQGTL